MDAPLYEVCRDCHLFVEPNDASGMDVAAYVHLHRGDVHDEALDETHEAKPSGDLRTIAEWKRTGPYAMQARFNPVTHRGS